MRKIIKKKKKGVLGGRRDVAGGGNSFRSLESSRRPWPPRRDGAGEVPAPTSAPCQGETGGHSRWASRMADTSTRTLAPHPGARRGTDRRTDRWTDKWEAPSPEGGRHREVSCGWFQGLISVWGHLLCPPVPLGRSGGVRTGGAEGSRPIFLLLAEQVGGAHCGGLCWALALSLQVVFPILLSLFSKENTEDTKQILVGCGLLTFQDDQRAHSSGKRRSGTPLAAQ